MTSEDSKCGMRNVRRLDGKDGVWRRKEDETAKIQMAEVDTKLCNIFLCPGWNVGLNLKIWLSENT